MPDQPAMQDGHHSKLMGTMGGALLTIADVHGEELLRAMILSMVGAASGFVISALLTWLSRQFRKRKKKIEE